MRAAPAAGLALLVLMPVVALTGCSRGKSPAGLAGIPPSGSVRILPRPLVEQPDRFQWQWTVIGDRNWTSPSVRDSVITIGTSYPLNSTTQAGGTHIYDVMVTVETTGKGAFRRTDQHISVRGSNATVAASNGVLTLSGQDVASTVKSLVARGGDYRLPANVPIAQIGKQQIVLKVGE